MNGARMTRETFRSPTSRVSHDPHRTRSAHRVLEQLECDVITEVEIIECSPFLHITAMEEDLAIIRQADKTIALANEELRNPTDRWLPPRMVRQSLARTLRRTRTLCAIEIFSHVRGAYTQRPGVLPLADIKGRMSQNEP